MELIGLYLRKGKLELTGGHFSGQKEPHRCWSLQIIREYYCIRNSMGHQRSAAEGLSGTGESIGICLKYAQISVRKSDKLTHTGKSFFHIF